MRPHRILIFAALGFLGACDALSPGVCTTEAHPAVRVTVQDQSTRVPMTDGTTGRIREGAYVDGLIPGSTSGTGTVLELVGGFERPGAYVVELEHPGYLDWRSAEVVASQGRCHVQTVWVVALMEAVP